MKKYNFLILALILVGIGGKAVAADEVDRTLTSEGLQIAAIKAESLPKGIKATKRGVIIDTGSGIRIKKVGKAKVSLSGGPLKAKMDIACFCQGVGHDGCTMTISEIDGRDTVTCGGKTCCNLKTVTGLQNEMRGERVGLNQPKDCYDGENTASLIASLD
jgi:hypothetical protein